MDYSAANSDIWNIMIQIGIISVIILVANILRRRVPIIKNSLIPTAVVGGVIMLIVKNTGIIPVDEVFLELLTYHFIAIGFIALSLRVPEKNDKASGERVGMKSGAIIVGSYMIQGIVGLIISLSLAKTIMPDLFEASGVLLPMGFGQGPGQANNIGASYETLGFGGGQSFGLAIAATGYICACVVGVIYINYLSKKGKVILKDYKDISGSVTVDTFQGENEIQISESIDRFSIQVALVLGVYLFTFLITWALTGFLTAYAPSVAQMLNSLLWGFNFMVGFGLATGLRVVLGHLKKQKVMHRQYQNNYLLSRIAGFAFDVMIVAGIGSIKIDNLSGLWLPFILMCIGGAVATFLHLRHVCRVVYPDYYHEGFVSMFGMMTGTITSGVLLLRELDPQLKTPAANNLISGSGFAIVLAIPLLIFVSLAPRSTVWTLISLLSAVIYYVFLLWITHYKTGSKAKKKVLILFVCDILVCADGLHP